MVARAVGVRTVPAPVDDGPPEGFPPEWYPDSCAYFRGTDAEIAALMAEVYGDNEALLAQELAEWDQHQAVREDTLCRGVP